MDGRTAMTVPPQAGYAQWLTAAAPAVDGLGWERHMSVDDLGDGVSIAMLDLVPTEDVVIAVEGPATFSVSIFLDGEGTLAIDGGQPLEVTPGTAVVCATDQTVSGIDTIRGGRRLRMMDVRFQPSVLQDLGGPLWRRYGGALLADCSVPERGAVMVGFPAPAPLLQIALQIISCAYAHRDLRRLYLRGKALELLAVVMGTFLNAGHTALRAERDQSKIDAAQRLMEERLHEPWTIARLARAVGLNEKSLKAGFRAHVGHSIHAYLTKVRMEAATQMLAEGRSVTEVALATGFASLSHFSTAFRKATGLPPSAFARRA